MALPAAHAALAFGMTRQRSLQVLLFLALLSVLPDFDFLLVLSRWGQPQFGHHRTWSHSLLFAGSMTVFWSFLRPGFLRKVSPGLFFSVLISHSILDLLCTSDAADHGVAILWPFIDTRYGWPVLVPLYLQFANSPFSLIGAVKFTTLELLLAGPLFFLTGMMRISFLHAVNRLKNLSSQAERDDREVEI